MNQIHLEKNIFHGAFFSPLYMDFEVGRLVYTYEYISIMYGKEVGKTGTEISRNSLFLSIAISPQISSITSNPTYIILAFTRGFAHAVPR